MKQKIRLGLFFGGQSTEHEVSVITALQAYENLDLEQYDVTAIYVAKTGDFYTGNKLLDLKNYQNLDSLLLNSHKVILGKKDQQAGFYILGWRNNFFSLDVALPCFHGSWGEDGSIQGLFAILRLPFVGFGVLGSAVGMDKIVQKQVFQTLGIPVGKYATVYRENWIKKPKLEIKNLTKQLKFPLFVKPATLGSSIGVGRAKDEGELEFNIEVASAYAEKILIEEAFVDAQEVNCAALGWEEDVEASVCEMPVSSGGGLSFADKYQKKASKGSHPQGMASQARVIPAPISPKLTKLIQQTTIKVFRALDGCGVARIDYFVRGDKFWINEINTIPGSLSYYLWEPQGIKYPELLDKLIKLALQRAQLQQKTQLTFESGLLQQMALKGGIKN
ncbi:D-alanine--D-alanine ligase [Patescibacteria group bacterium]|nr:D-alanine--D-alanine ligase [Patescibacteria group bacterium]MCL5409987.1 D-alanine--D-alanine ligase [Patescibacteria group bacterium]